MSTSRHPKFVIKLTPEYGGALRELCNETHSSSSEVIRAALRLYQQAVNNKKRGYRLAYIDVTGGGVVPTDLPKHLEDK